MNDKVGYHYLQCYYMLLKMTTSYKGQEHDLLFYVDSTNETCQFIEHSRP